MQDTAGDGDGLPEAPKPSARKAGAGKTRAPKGTTTGTVVPDQPGPAKPRGRIRRPVVDAGSDPAQVWREARRLYEETDLSQAMIAARLKVTTKRLAYRIRQEGWMRRGEALEGFADAEPDEQARMIARLYRAFETQVARLEDRLGRLMAGETGEGAKLSDMDQGARTLASLARTLDTLMDLQKSRSEETDDGPDPDSLRAELARRLAGLWAGGTDGGGAGPAEPERDGLPAEGLADLRP